MTERQAIKYSVDAYWRAIHSGRDAAGAAQAAIAKFRTLYPNATDSEIREKLAHGVAERRIGDRHQRLESEGVAIRK